VQAIFRFRSIGTSSKVIRYMALEGPEAGTYFRGTAGTSGKKAVIEVPESFRIVTDEEGLTVPLALPVLPARGGSEEARRKRNVHRDGAVNPGAAQRRGRTTVWEEEARQKGANYGPPGPPDRCSRLATVSPRPPFSSAGGSPSSLY
jgi:hypothetical protein